MALRKFGRHTFSIPATRTPPFSVGQTEATRSRRSRSMVPSQGRFITFQAGLVVYCETIATLPGGWDLAHPIRLGIKPSAELGANSEALSGSQVDSPCSCRAIFESAPVAMLRSRPGPSSPSDPNSRSGRRERVRAWRGDPVARRCGVYAWPSGRCLAGFGGRRGPRNPGET